MGVIEQLQFEVAEQAGSPQGLVRLIHLLLQEVENLDVTSPDTIQQYFVFLRAYVLVKRQLVYFNRRCEVEDIGTAVYRDTLLRLKSAIKAKREEAHEYAAKTIPPEKLKKFNKMAGTRLGLNPRDVCIF